MAEAQQLVQIAENPPDYLKDLVLDGEAGRVRGVIWAAASAPYPGPHGVELSATSLRFTGIMRHAQLLDTGHLLPGLASSQAGPLELLTVAHAILHGPVREPLPDLGDLREFWRHHPEDCLCERGRLLPMPFELFAELPRRKQHEKLAELQALIQEQNVQAYHRMATVHARRQSQMALWQGMTPQPALYSPGAHWQQDWFAETFWTAMQAGTPEAFTAICTEVTAGVWSFDLFSQLFCDQLVAELDAFEASPLDKSRPNSMNNYGLILDDIGLESLMHQLVTQVVQPLAALLLADVPGARSLDHHHAFIVDYAQGRDVSLDMHTDDSEITLNVNVRSGFEGSDLTFCGRRGTPARRQHTLSYQHQRGRGVLHAGIHTHGAQPLTHGARSNLILWCRSSTHRMAPGASAAYRFPLSKEEPPDLICLSRTHDRDYDAWHNP